MNNRTKMITVAVVVAALVGLVGMIGFGVYKATNKGPVIEVSEANFEQEVLNSDLPVLVEFYATWCGPCKEQAPIVEALAAEYEGKVKFVKIDVDQNPNLAAAMQVQVLPTIYLIKADAAAKQVNLGGTAFGVNTGEQLRKMIDDGLVKLNKPKNP